MIGETPSLRPSPRIEETNKEIIRESALAIFSPEAMVLSASGDALEAGRIAFIGLDGSDQVFLLELINVP